MCLLELSASLVGIQSHTLRSTTQAVVHLMSFMIKVPVSRMGWFCALSKPKDEQKAKWIRYYICLVYK